jgi:hypothetical protein
LGEREQWQLCLLFLREILAPRRKSVPSDAFHPAHDVRWQAAAAIRRIAAFEKSHCPPPHPSFAVRAPLQQRACSPPAIDHLPWLPNLNHGIAWLGHLS